MGGYLEKPEIRATISGKIVLIIKKSFVYLAPMEAKPKEISEFSDTTLLIVWNDGHESLYLYEDLRNACPCASCSGSGRSGEKGRSSFKKTIPIRVESRNIRPNEIEDVGLYAIRFKWNDRHETGIYTFEFLRDLCTCDECRPVA